MAHLKTQTLLVGAEELSGKLDAFLLDFEELDSAILAGQVQVLVNELRAPYGCINAVFGLHTVAEQVPLNHNSIEPRGN